MRKKIFKTIAAISLLCLIIVLCHRILPAKAAGSLTNVSDTMERLKKNTPANQTIEFTIGSNVPNGGYIEIVYSTAWQDFPGMGGGGFLWFLKYASLVPETAYAYPGVFSSDVDVEVYNETMAHTYTDSLECNIGTEEMDVRIYTEPTKKVILLEFCPGDGGSLTAGDTIKIYAGAFTTETVEDGTNKIVNPLAASTYSLNLRTTNNILTTIDSGSLAVSIVDDDQVIITANVDPTFTFQISSNTCGLGLMTVSTVKTCDYTLAVGTNATGGAKITIQAISDGTNALLNRDGAPADDINDIAENSTVSAGTEGYGIALTNGGTWTEVGDFNDDDTPIPSALTEMLSVAVPVLITTTNTVTHRAAISATSAAGTYTQTVQYIATGTF